MSEWISVKDKLPEMGKGAVIVACEHMRYRVGIAWPDGRGNWIWPDGTRGGIEVTDWMPLPEPPNSRAK